MKNLVIKVCQNFSGLSKIKKILCVSIPIIIFAIIIIFVSQSKAFLTNDQKDKIITKIWVTGDLVATRQKVIELYENDRQTELTWFMAISQGESNDYKDKLVVQDKNFDIDGNYCYVKGSVKNTGDRTISYFKITVQYINDNGDVLDSDYTNSGENVNSGDSKEFEVMHRYSNSYTKYRVIVDEVRID